MSGQAYELPVWETITTAWDKTMGVKGSFWASLGVLFAIMFGFGVIQGLTESNVVIAVIVSLISNVIGYLIQLGLIYMGIRRAKDQPIDFKMMFFAFDLNVAMKVVGLYILQVLIFIIPILVIMLGSFLISSGKIAPMILGSILCIASAIGALVVGVRISLSMAFVLDTGLAPVAAIKASFAATDQNFWNLLGLFLLEFIIIVASIIPLGIGLIWTLPFCFICYGLIYQRLRSIA